MKVTQNIDWPIISLSNEKDERVDGVFLLGGDCEEKITAQDRCGYWIIREWESSNEGGIMYWCERSSYSIDTEILKTLYALIAHLELREKLT